MTPPTCLPCCHCWCRRYDEFRKVLWRPLELSSSRRFSCISAYKYIHAKFVNDPNQENLYKVHR